MADTTKAILLVHLAATAAMVGLIWTIQLNHYPQFHALDRATFVEAMTRHQTNISFLVFGFGGLEALSALALLVERPDGIGIGWALVGLALLGVAWGVTVIWSAPAHGVLSGGYDEATLDRLIATNWMRTAAWTARGLLAAAVLWVALD